MPEKLTANVIKKLKPRANRYVVTDSKTTGLAVLISPNGSKYFYYRYRPSIYASDKAQRKSWSELPVSKARLSVNLC